MDEHRFDEGLARRLRAYEARMPDAPLPAEDRIGRSRPVGWAALALGGAAVVAAAVFAIVVIGGVLDAPVGAPESPSASPSASASASPTDSPSSSEAPGSTEPASAAPSPTASSELAWTTFPATDGSETWSEVTGITRSSEGMVAVGVRYLAPVPGNLGPEPIHEAAFWRSTDGRDWTEVELTGIPSNLHPEGIVATNDGRLVMIGNLSEAEEGDEYTRSELGIASYISADGQGWSALDTGVAGDGRVADAQSGGRGTVALVQRTDATELWHSADGVGWQLVRTEEVRNLRIAAGDEGFVATAGSAEPYTIASGDGVEWFEATAPPPILTSVVSRNGDWFATGWPPSDADGYTGEDVEVWFSANGLDWERHAMLDLRQEGPEDAGCTEIPMHAVGAGGHMVVSTALTYPCSEGWYQMQGRQLLSTDGTTWETLPFEALALEQREFGSVVTSAIADGGRLVLGGYVDGHATFWIRE